MSTPLKLTAEAAHNELSARLRTIPEELELSRTFPPEVRAEADAAVASRPLPETDRTDLEFVTIDPARDTPQVLKPYLKSFGPRFVGLTGSEAAITLISHEYSVYAAKQPIKGGGYAMTHSSTIYLMGPNGKFVTHYEESIGPDGLAADLRKRI